MSGTFGCLQKTAFVGLFIGSLLCLVGIVGSEWIVRTDTYGYTSSISRIGLWTSNRDSLDAVKGCAITCLVLCGTCTIVVLGMACRCQGSSTVCIGVITFFSSLFGFTAIGVFTGEFDDCGNYSYGWAFAFFLTGTIFLMLASVAAVFGNPKVPRVQVTPAKTIYGSANVTRVTAQLPLITTRPKKVQFSVVATRLVNVQPAVVATRPVNVQPAVVATRPVNVQPSVAATGPVNVQTSVVATKPLAPGMYSGQNGEGPYYPQYNNCVFADRIIMIHNSPK